MNKNDNQLSKDAVVDIQKIELKNDYDYTKILGEIRSNKMNNSNNGFNSLRNHHNIGS